MDHNGMAACLTRIDWRVLRSAVYFLVADLLYLGGQLRVVLDLDKYGSPFWMSAPKNQASLV
jgi:uncharacterized membrane protein YhhN